MTKELTKKEIKRQMKSLEILEVEAKKEIGNILELDSSILDNIHEGWADAKINIDKYRADIEMYGDYIFVVSNISTEVEYSTSVYSTSITKKTDEKDRNEYKKILSVFIKLLDTETSEKVKSLLEKYMKLAG